MSSSHKRKNQKYAYKKYIAITSGVLAVMLAITVLTVLITIKPVKALVHQIEARYEMSVDDIELNDSSYLPLSDTSIKPEEFTCRYGDKIANISSSDFGLNCSVYFGSNIKSMSAGAGLSGESKLFGDNGISFLTGYCETSFSPLSTAKAGDIINVTANYGEYVYKVSEVKYIASDKEAYKDDGSERLVLCGICSDFSDHKGESLYVFAERVKGGN